MGQAIPRQQPAVVLRSRFNQLRALLAIALAAVAGLTVAVVILSNDADEVSSTSSAQPIESINYGGSKNVNPSTGHPTVPFPQLAHPLQNRIDGTRYDGGADEGTADVTPAQPPNTSHDGGAASRYETEAKHFIVPPTGSGRPQDGGSPEGTRSAVKDYSKNGATGDYAHGPLPPDAPAKAQSTSSKSQYGTGPDRFGRP
jgi:hypothetical protein